MYNVNINFINNTGVIKAIDIFVKKCCISCHPQQISNPFCPLNITYAEKRILYKKTSRNLNINNENTSHQ